MQHSRYRILGQIGQGQFGRVFCAVNRENGEVFALKDLALKQFPTHKFLRELAYLVSLRHQNIVSFHGLEHHQKGRYLVMDYCEGGTLRDLMESGQSLTLKLIFKLIEDILSALVHAHRQKIIHCDIKPENILLKLTPSGYIAKLSDFGIARWSEEQLQPSETGGYTGSPAYMAPERFYGKYSPASDLYSVGIIFYELLVGQRPFSGLPKDLMTAHLSQSFDLSDTIPPVLQAIIEKALRKLPQRRFASSQEMLEAVISAKKELLQFLSNQLFIVSPCIFESDACFQIKQILLPNPVEILGISKKSIDLGLENHLIRQVYDSKTLLFKESLQHQIDFKDRIIKIESCAGGIFIFTFSQTTNQYFIYYLANDSNLEQLSLTPLFSWAAHHLMSTIEPNGKWLAIILDLHTLEIYSLANFKLIQSFKLSGIVQQILAFDRFHGLVIEQLKNYKTRFSFFNRRGKLYPVYSISLALELFCLNKTRKYQSFALERANSNLGILLELKPLKMTRIALPIRPNFILALSCGYLLANTTGELILLDHQGAIKGRTNLEKTITAMSVRQDDLILVATESNQQYYLHQFEIQNNSL